LCFAGKFSAEGEQMESMTYELKYCEGCGTLKLRPVGKSGRGCRVCEQLLARFRFPRKVLGNPEGLPLSRAQLKMAAMAVPAVSQTAAGGAL
jgi:hypothetical protein